FRLLTAISRNCNRPEAALGRQPRARVKQVMPVGGPLPPVPPGNTRGCNGSAPQRYHPLTLASWYGYLPVLHRGWQTLNCKVSSRIDERGIYSTQAQLFDSSIHRHALSNPSKVQPDSWRQDNAPALLVYLDI